MNQHDIVPIKCLKCKTSVDAVVYDIDNYCNLGYLQISCHGQKEFITINLSDMFQKVRYAFTDDFKEVTE